MEITRVPAGSVPLHLLVDAEVERCHSPLRTWLPDRVRRHALEVSLAEPYAWINDASFARTYHQNCPMPGTTANDYNPALFRCATGLTVLAGIHFWSLNPPDPFIHISAISRPTLEDLELEALIRKLPQHFKVFKPRWLRLMEQGEDLCTRLASLGAAQRHRYLAAPLTNLSRSNGDTRHPELQIIPFDGVIPYETYLRAYAHCAELIEGFAELAEPEELETLEVLAGEGNCFEIRLGNKSAGLFAVDWRNDYCVSGWCVVEFILWPEFRSRGLSRQIQTLVARHLDRRASSPPSDAATLLYGTIHARNAPAQQAAARAGRQLIAADCWLPLAT